MEDSIQKEMRQRLEVLQMMYASALPKPMQKIRERREIMFPLSDGVKLRTILWLPEGDDPFPTIVQRVCYPQMEYILEIIAREYCKRGYVFLIQWCRGTGGSEGTWEPNVNERQDGLDTLQWLNDQSFVDCIGFWGNSYLAFTGWVLADVVPPKVRSMYLGVYGTDRYTSAYKDGMFRQDILTAWAMENTGSPIHADYLESYLYRPQIEVDEKLWNVRLDWYRDWIGNADRDCSYWSQGFWKMLKDIPGKVNIPVFIRDGWYDHHLGSALVSYEDLSVEAKEHSILQLGPWNHEYQVALSHQSTDELIDDSVQSVLDWFELTLKKKILPDKEIREYVIGADTWKIAKVFPPPVKRVRTLYFNTEACLGNKYGLQEVMTDFDKSFVQYVYDPENPVYSHGGESLLHTKAEVGSLLQLKCGYRKDIISFVSGVFAESFEIHGAIVVKLFVSSDAADTAFSAKVMEIFQDEKVVNIRGSLSTLAYRKGTGKRETYIPSDIVEIDLVMWAIAWKIQAGSSLRIDISSSDFPQYSIHSNYPGNWALQDKTKKAYQTIYSGKDFPSCVELPCDENGTM